MNALSDELLALLDEIRAALAEGKTADALIGRLDSLWREERPDDLLGLEALLNSLRVRPTKELAFEESPSGTFEFLGADRGAEHPAAGGGWIYPVYFGTNRGRAGDGFSTARGGTVTYGRCDVFIPATHRFGGLGTPWYKRWLQGRFADDHLQLRQTEVLNEAEFWTALQAEMARGAADGKPHGLVYLHGYRNDFEAAAIRAAQIGFDLKVSGATAFFSWPSQGTFEGYPADAAAIEASEAAITRFLVDVARHSGAAVMHVVAHSMGNRGLLRALQRMAADAELMAGVKFGQIFLAAPDVDRDLFLGLVDLYPKFSVRTTLYASRGDRAVAGSAWLHSAPRAGYFYPITETKLPTLNTVLVPNFDLDLIGHSYFAEADALLNDMFNQMANDTPPGQRQRLLTEGGHWVMQR